MDHVPLIVLEDVHGRIDAAARRPEVPAQRSEERPGQILLQAQERALPYVALTLWTALTTSAATAWLASDAPFE